MRLIEDLTMGRVRKLDVGEGFYGMSTPAGGSCPSTRPHINLLRVPDLRACTCSMYNVHVSLVSVGTAAAYFIHVPVNSETSASFIAIKG